MGFDKDDLLREAGFTEGDYVTLQSVSALEDRTISTSSTSFTLNDSFIRQDVKWSTIVPSTAQGAWYAVVEVLPGTGETASVDLFNDTENTQIASQTGITSDTTVGLGPVSYTPNDTDSFSKYTIRFRTDPGANSSLFNAPTMSVGVLL